MQRILEWKDWNNFVDYVSSQNILEAIATPATGEAQPSDEIKTQTVKIKTSYAIQQLAAKFKFFAEILYRLDIIYTYSSEIPTAATDGCRIFINPNFFYPLTQKQIIFIMCHEVMHVALLHITRINGRDHDRWNVAGDYEINLLLANEGLMTVEEIAKDLEGLINKDYANKNAEQLYNDPNMKMPDQPQPSDGPSKPGSGSGKPGDLKQPPQPGSGSGSGKPGEPGEGEGEGSGEGSSGTSGKAGSAGGRKPGADEPIETGHSDHPITVVRGPMTGQMIDKKTGDRIAGDEGEDQSKDLNEDALKSAIRASAQRNLTPRNKNKGSGNNGDIYQRIMELTETKVNWRTELAKFIGKIAHKSEFKMPNRRYVSSGQYRYGLEDTDNALENAVVALDVSGSVASSFPEFAAEVVGIVKAKKIKTISVLPFADTVVTPFQVKGFKKPTPDDFAQVRTGGGTEAIPHVIRWVDEKLRGRIDFAVIVTDGYLTNGLPDPPRWGFRCIWLVFDNEGFTVPPTWGKVIHATGDRGYW